MAIRIRTTIKMILKAEITLKRSTRRRRHSRARMSNPMVPIRMIDLVTSSGALWMMMKIMTPIIKAKIADIFSPFSTALNFK